MAETVLDRSYDTFGQILREVWSQIIAAPHREAHVTITYPGDSFDADICIVRRYDTGFHFWQPRTRNRYGIWVFNNVQERDVLSADFEFNLPKNGASGPTFGRIIEADDGYWLAHVGQLGGGANSVSRKDFRIEARKRGVAPVNVAGHDLFVISKLTDRAVVSDLIKFASLCREIRREKCMASSDPRANTLQRSGFNPGYEGEYDRTATVSGERHVAIARALKRSCEALGWRVADAGNVLPDLLVTDGVCKVLFEVKPASTSTNLLMALGQLLVYDREVQADRRFVVAPDLDDCWSSTLFEHIRSVLDQHRVARLTCTRVRNSWTFPGLAAELGRSP